MMRAKHEKQDTVPNIKNNKTKKGITATHKKQIIKKRNAAKHKTTTKIHARLLLASAQMNFKTKHRREMETQQAKQHENIKTKITATEPNNNKQHKPQGHSQPQKSNTVKKYSLKKARAVFLVIATHEPQNHRARRKHRTKQTENMQQLKPTKMEQTNTQNN